MFVSAGKGRGKVVSGLRHEHGCCRREKEAQRQEEKRFRIARVRSVRQGRSSRPRRWNVDAWRVYEREINHETSKRRRRTHASLPLVVIHAAASVSPVFNPAASVYGPVSHFQWPWICRACNDRQTQEERTACLQGSQGVPRATRIEQSTEYDWARVEGDVETRRSFFRRCAGITV